jgi:hypothetical protein
VKAQKNIRGRFAINIDFGLEQKTSGVRPQVEKRRFCTSIKTRAVKQASNGLKGLSATVSAW